MNSEPITDLICGKSAENDAQKCAALPYLSKESEAFSLSSEKISELSVVNKDDFCETSENPFKKQAVENHPCEKTFSDRERLKAVDLEKVELKTAEITSEKTENSGGVFENKKSERYRAEFNEFRYARYAKTVIADFCDFSMRRIKAELPACEKNNIYGCAVTTRGLYVVNSALKKGKKPKISLFLNGKGNQKNKRAQNSEAKRDDFSCRGECFSTCAVIGSSLFGAASGIVIKEVKYARRLGADEIEACVSSECVSLSDGKALKKEIRALKRAANKTFLKLGIKLSELNDLQAESFLSIAASLKIKAFVLYGECAFERLKRLKSFAPHCRFELKSGVSNEQSLCALLDCGAEKVYSYNFGELCSDLKKGAVQ